MKFLSSYELSLVFYGMRSFIQILIYIFIILTLNSMFKDKNLTLTKLQSITIILIICFNLSLPAFSSNDFYYYLGLGRIQSIQNVNPYLIPIANAPEKEITSIIGVWVNITAMYAPILTYFFKLVTSISTNLLTEIFFLKILTLIAYLSVSILVYKISEFYKEGLGKLSAMMFLIHPLSIDEILINGHNDIFVILTSLIAINFAIRSKFVLAFFFLFISILIKFPFAILVPIFLSLPKSYKDEENSQSLSSFFKKIIWNSLRYALPAFIMTLPLIVFFYFEYFQNKESFKAFAILGSMWTTSTPAMIAVFFKEIIGISIGKAIGIILFVRFCFFPFLFYRSYKIKDKKTFLEEITFVLILFYLIFTAYIWPWYWVITIPLVFFRQEGTYVLHIISISIGFVLFWIFFHWNGKNLGLSLFQVKLIEYSLTYSLILILFIFPSLEKKIYQRLYD
ncbi:MAG: hypothetical protein SFU98_20000 [Leptospiraceae bacterium]|nr:hypothetical protein [Leptospiraceae bacterium]